MGRVLKASFSRTQIALQQEPLRLKKKRQATVCEVCERHGARKAKRPGRPGVQDAVRFSGTVFGSRVARAISNRLTLPAILDML